MLSLVFHFIVFSGNYLAMDTCRIIADDQKISNGMKAYVSRCFPEGTPTSERRWVCEILEDSGIDPKALWTRLESEGAPMKYPATGP